MALSLSIPKECAVTMQTLATAEQRAAAHQLLELIGGSWATQAIGVAARLGLADHVASGVTQVVNLAQVCDCDADALHRLLRGLAALGVLGLVQTDHNRRSVAPRCRTGTEFACAVVVAASLGRLVGPDGQRAHGDGFSQPAVSRRLLGSASASGGGLVFSDRGPYPARRRGQDDHRIVPRPA